jgi:hypothetical protein
VQVQQRPVGRVVTQQDLAAVEGRLHALERTNYATTLALEKRLSELEGAVRELNVSLTAAISARTAEVGSATPERIELLAGVSPWQSLVKGMTQAAVVSRLGEPTKRQRSGPYENWYYSSSSLGPSVWFENGRAVGWQEP